MRRIHTTNYFNTLILPAADCPATQSTAPPLTDKVSVARMQYEMVVANPYQHTSDDVLFDIYVHRNDIAASARAAAHETFFAKGLACFRASPLSKRYGWVVHFNEEGKMALIEQQSPPHLQLASDPNLKTFHAMRTTRRL